MDNRNLFPTILQAVKSEMKELADLMSGGGLFYIDGTFLLCAHMVEKAR
jgi:hypothetical protein